VANVWDPTNVIQSDAVKQILIEQVPNLPIKSIEQIGEGFDNTVFILNDEILLRFPRRENAVTILEVEKKLLPFIKDYISFQTTIPFIFGQPSEKYPWPFLGYNVIKGKPPIRLNRQERINMIEPLAKILKQIHSIPLSTFSHLKLPHDELRRLDIKYRKPQFLKYAEEAIKQKLLPNEMMIKQYIENLQEIIPKTPLVLVHGDLHFKNMIVNDDNALEGIIDWGDAHIGQCELDLSIVFSIIPSDKRDSFYEIYGNISNESKLLAQFKSIYTTVILLLFANENHDKELVRFCQENLINALT